jgi:hypothetical protein
VIRDVLAQSARLLGSDPGDLGIPAQLVLSLGQATGTTYRQAFQQISASGSRALAGKFVRAVLALRKDPRVQGVELEAGPNNSQEPD